jgi:TetR/AcrR family transcriptional repressor of mexCD-oprJ operon
VKYFATITGAGTDYKSGRNIYENKYWDSYISALDGFFLKGQKEGFFRLEMSSQMLTELFVSMICGMIDAEHRNRVASAGMVDRMAEFFLEGARR